MLGALNILAYLIFVCVFFYKCTERGFILQIMKLELVRGCVTYQGHIARKWQSLKVLLDLKARPLTTV